MKYICNSAGCIFNNIYTTGYKCTTVLFTQLHLTQLPQQQFFKIIFNRKT